ncbi:CRISPR-associated endoribonuclease Cas6 [Marinitoga lauensis]|uniref:CRISPR-associated endoribonuclease Cas6 n=1 Tax=Marinitoga lauensis TaxID=2201189 RepID=UPI0014045CAD|nr:CRISPR-associated endoribonuclease Cas6 [Marinitoga lauensis]
MRLKLVFRLKSNVISKDYRRIFMSFIKKSLENYDKEIFEEYFKNKDPILKDYTFSVYFGKCRFEENIKLENDNISMFFSTSSYKTGMHFYNAFRAMKYKDFPTKNNILKLNNIIRLSEKNIYKNEIIIKTLSPILIREHNKEKDNYYYFDDENATEILKNSIIYQYNKLFGNGCKSFDIKVLDLKKTTVLNYNKKLKSNLGVFKATGDKEILNFIYKSGIGSKRSSGFGMVDII